MLKLYTHTNVFNTTSYVLLKGLSQKHKKNYFKTKHMKVCINPHQDDLLHEVGDHIIVKFADDTYM